MKTPENPMPPLPIDSLNFTPNGMNQESLGERVLKPTVRGLLQERFQRFAGRKPLSLFELASVRRFLSEDESQQTHGQPITVVDFKKPRHAQVA